MNIMCVPTKHRYIGYIYNQTQYYVPTYGKIYKIIDFGRAIYRFHGQLFCGDGYDIHGEAHSQYNTEPFFDSTKPRIDPNPSFDLCRLGCALYDLIGNQIPVVVDWCMDDDGRNILYKKSGEERYEGFKLYKMIARKVHRHTPQAQLERPEFQSFIYPHPHPHPQKQKQQTGKGKKVDYSSAPVFNVDSCPVLY
jgi:hypothetical protein